MSARRIAIFRALYLGDLLLCVPALRAFRAAYPDAEITLIGLPWAAAFARRFGRYVDRFVEFPGFEGISEVPFDPARSTRFIAEQRAYGYDLAVQMHGSGRSSNRFVAALGAAVSAGYYDPLAPSSAVLTVCAPYPDNRPEVLRNLELAALLDLPSADVRLEFPLCEADRAEAAALLGRLPAAGGPLVGLHAGASLPMRRWPAERFASVADHLARRHGARVVLTAGKGEEETAHAVAACMATAPLDLAGATSLGGLGALLERLDLFISNDTGPCHLAAALDVPSVTIFGPGDHRRWAPLDASRHPIVRHAVPCSPCFYRECPIDRRCLLSIETAQVIAVAEGLLVRERRQGGAGAAPPRENTLISSLFHNGEQSRLSGERVRCGA